MGRAPYLYRTVPHICKSGSAQMPIPELTENYQKYPTEFFKLKWLKRLGTLHLIYFFFIVAREAIFPPNFSINLQLKRDLFQWHGENADSAQYVLERLPA